MEPTAQTLQEVGRLCLGWSHLEVQSEHTICGLLALNEDHLRLFIWKLGLRDRWALIKREAKTRLSTESFERLQALSSPIATAMRDRNIIIHGVVTMTMASPLPWGANVPDHHFNPEMVQRVPCWTIFMGEGAGKNFPVSLQAVQTVQRNIQTIGDRLAQFNVEHGFLKATMPRDEVEAGWPKPLPE